MASSGSRPGWSRVRVSPRTGRRTYFGVSHGMRFLYGGICVVGAACTPLLLYGPNSWTDVLILYAFCSPFYLLSLVLWRARLVIDRGGVRRVVVVGRRTRRDDIRSVEMAPRLEVFSPWVPEMTLTSGVTVGLGLLRDTSGDSAPPDGLLAELAAIREVLGLGRWDARAAQDPYLLDDIPERFVVRSAGARAAPLATFASFGLLAVLIPLGSFGHWPVITIAIYLSAVLVMLGWFCVRSWRLGARFDSSGVVVRNFLGTRRLRWDEIDSFADGVTFNEGGGKRWALRIFTCDGSSVTVRAVERSPAALTRLRRVAALHHIPAQLSGEVPS